MCRIRAALAVLTIMLISLLVAGPASAGGPTSVLLVAPGNGQTASLYTGSADYQALEELVGASGTGPAGTAAPSGAGHESGSAVTVTWLIHDVLAWRVDRLYFEADGGPWISTQSVAVGEGNIYDSPVVWHVAKHGKVLEALLNRLGVSPYPTTSDNAPVAGGSSVGADAGTNIAAPGAAATPATTAVAHTATPGTAGFVWGLAGLALGIALTVAGMRLLPSFRGASGDLATAEPEGTSEPERTEEPAEPAETAEGGLAAVGIGPRGPDREPSWSSADDLSLPSHWR